MKRYVIFFICTLLFVTASPAKASVIINEIFSDPASGLTGDANNDGVRSGSHDEFVEILNYGSSQVDISGWSLADRVSARHVFPLDTVLSPYTFLAVFGGGSPSLSNSDWQVASTGTLGLNNSSDTVSLFDINMQLVDEVVYGSIAGHDQSITLFPDGEGSEFVQHSSLDQSQGALFSPGTSVDLRAALVLVDEEIPSEDVHPGNDNPVVPELPTLMYFAMGGGSLLLKKRA